jgi:hypothetical protein
MIASEWVAVVSGVVAVVAFSDSVLTRYVRAKGRRYAAENDFAILKQEFIGMRSTLEMLESDLRKLERNVAVLEALTRVNTIVRNTSPAERE